MKTNKFLFVMSTVLLFSVTDLSIAQGIGHWRVNGNSTTPPDNITVAKLLKLIP